MNHVISLNQLRHWLCFAISDFFEFRFRTGKIIREKKATSLPSEENMVPKWRWLTDSWVECEKFKFRKFNIDSSGEKVRWFPKMYSLCLHQWVSERASERASVCVCPNLMHIKSGTKRRQESIIQGISADVPHFAFSGVVGFVFTAVCVFVFQISLLDEIGFLLCIFSLRPLFSQS